MRIALITPGFSASEDDWCIPALLDLVRTLSGEHEVVVFALRYPAFDATYHVHGAEVHAFGGGTAGGAKRVILFWRAFWRFLSAHREYPFDVVHGFWADEPGWLAVAAGRIVRVPSVVSLMGGELIRLPDIEYGGQLNRMNRVLTAIALRGATKVIIGSDYLQRIALARVAPDRLVQLPLGIDSALFNLSSSHGEAAVELSGCPAILSVGSLVAVKDHLMLLRALAAIVPVLGDIHLHIVGHGPLRSHLDELACSLGVSAHVTFHGDVSHERLPAYFRSADLLVVSSRHESQSMVALEAAACGCPVLGTGVGILPEISITSRSLPVGDADTFAATVVAVLGDTQQLSSLRDQGIDLVEGRFTLEHTIPTLVALYSDLVEK